MYFTVARFIYIPNNKSKSVSVVSSVIYALSSVRLGVFLSRSSSYVAPRIRFGFRSGRIGSAPTRVLLLHGPRAVRRAPWYINMDSPS
jgi:hypothetical protein